MATATVTAASTSKPLFASVMRAEWIKLRTVRSTWWCLGVSAVGLIAVAAIASYFWAANFSKISPVDRVDYEPIRFSMHGLGIAQIAIGVLGILFVTGEYTSGLMRTSLIAVPQRLHLMLAKATVCAAAVLVVGTVSTFTAFFVGQPFLNAKHIGAKIQDPGALRILLGAALFLVITVILGIGIGTFVRHTGGAIVTFIGLQFILPIILLLLPTGVRHSVSKYLFSTAGDAILHLRPEPGMLSPWAGLGVYAAWALAALIAAIVVIRRRDA